MSPLHQVGFALGLAALGAADLAWRRLPNPVTMALLAGGLLQACLATRGPWDGLVGLGCGAALLGIPYALGLVGGGDVKAAAGIGAWLGGIGTLLAVGAGLVVAGVFALGGLAAGRARRVAGAPCTRPPASVPLGAALAVGAAWTAWGRA